MARYLLDSNAFVWAKNDPKTLSAKALEAIEESSNRIFVSLASLWELAIKAANGKLDFYARLVDRGSDAVSKALRESNLDLLPIELHHVLSAARLPQHHRDPFDRLIIAQALEENLTLITSDRVFQRYAGIRVIET